MAKEEHPQHNKQKPANSVKIRVRVQLKGGGFHDFVNKVICVASIKKGSDIKIELHMDGMLGSV